MQILDDSRLLHQYIHAQNNTFQSVLATDGESSFVLFLYEEEGIQWTTGDSDGGEQGVLF